MWSCPLFGSSALYFAVGEPDYLVVRGAGADTLGRASIRGHAFQPLFAVVMPNLGVTRPLPVRYTVYRVVRARADGGHAS